MKLSLGWRLLLITLAGIAPMLAVLAYNELSVRQARSKELSELALSNAEQASMEIERLMVGAENVLKAVTAAPAVKTFNAQTCGPYLADLKKRIPELSTIVIYDAAGNSRCRSDDRPPGSNYADRPYFTEAIKTPQKLIIGDYTVGRTSGAPGLPLALAILGDDGRPAGVAAAGLDLEWLSGSLKKRQLAKNSSLTIADRRGIIIAREPLSERFVGTQIPEPYLALVNADHSGTEYVVSQDGTTRIIGYIPAKVPPSIGLYLSAGISVDDAFTAINKSTGRAVVIGALASAVSLFLAFLLSRQLVQGPVRRIQRVLSARRRGKERVRTGMVTADGELDALGAEFDAFMDELSIAKAEREKAEERRQLMTRELSHRLKNIIATIQSVANQSLRKSAQPEALDAFMRRLNSIAQAHNLLLEDGAGGATIRNAVSTAIAPFAEPVSGNFRVGGPDFRLKPSAVQSISMALHELCTNAAKYGALSTECGHVDIQWQIHGDSGELFQLVWREIGGPAVSKPSSTGFGSKMIERVLAAELSADVHLQFDHGGVTCEINAPLFAILDGDEPLGPSTAAA